MFKKSALVIVQGINSDREYMIPTSKLVKEFFKGYDTVEYAYTEDEFDKGWFNKISDRFDFIPYFLSKSRRKKVCRVVNEKIASLDLLGYNVDVVAHSLGSIITLQSGRSKFPVKIRNLLMLQSPIHNNLYGWYVRSQVIKYSTNILITNIISTFNKEDRFVASKPINIDSFLKNFKGYISKFVQTNKGSGHDWQKALVDILKKVNV
jgi:hypothetical protein